MMQARGSSTGWNMLLSVSLLAIVGLLGIHFLVPQKSAVKPIDADLATIARGVKQAQDKSRDLTKEAEKSTWDLDQERLGTRTLALVTDLAEKAKLKLAGFRIDRATDVGGLREATYVAVLEGPYPDVAKVLATLEDPQSKLVVSLFQVSSTDPDSNKVTATVGLVGFLPIKPKNGLTAAKGGGGAKS